MKKYVVKVPAKVNFTIDVEGLNGNYHNLKSLVASVNIYDAITLLKRKDNKITVTMHGKPVDCGLLDNNAYKAAKLFKEKYSTLGVDVIVDKNIPVGGGLGGSSADVAGVLIAMKNLFEMDIDIRALAGELGSDSVYMVDGGWATISGRGEKVQKQEINQKIYLLIVTDDASVSARQCYKEFDKQGQAYKSCTSKAVKALKEQNLAEFFKLVKNDLLESAKKFAKNIELNQRLLELSGANAVVMTGSGSAVIGLFSCKEERDKSYKKLQPLLTDKLLKAETL